MDLAVLDGVGRPRFIWRTSEVTIKPPSQVDEAFSWDAGEGDQEGFEMDDEILTLFERFEVVWPLDVADGINGPTSAST